MLRFLIVAAFLSTAMFASDCNAQTRRGLFKRHSVRAKVANSWPQPIAQASPGFNSGNDLPQPYRFPTRDYFETRNPIISRVLDGKMTYRYRDPAEIDSRYMGGLHRSTFENIGIPSGDIGIRGNAYNWRTW